MATERSVTRVDEAETPAAVNGEAFDAALAEMAVLALGDPEGPVERHLRAIVGVLPVTVYALDHDGIFTSSYGGGLAALGLADDELVGSHISVFGPEAVRTFERVLDGTAQSFEVEGDTDGELWAIKTIVAPLPDRSGVVAVGIDLTEGRLQERVNSKGRAMLAAAVEAIEEGVLIQDAQGHVLQANTSAFEALGLQQGDLSPLLDRSSGWNAIREDGTPFAIEDFPGRNAVLDGQARTGITMGVVDPHGATRWLLINAFPIEVSGDPLLVLTFTDITEQREMTRALRENEERFRMLSASAPIGIFLTDRDRTITYANPELQRQTGLSSEALQTKSWTDIIHPEDAQLVTDELRTFFRDERPYLLEHRLVRSDGSIRWVRARLARMTDALGEVVGLVGTAADITDLVAASDRLRESEERTRAILETAAEGIISTDSQGVIIEFNAAAERILGYDSEDVVGRLCLHDLLAPELRPVAVEMFDGYRAGTGELRFVDQGSAEVPFEAKDGSIVPIELAITQVRTSEGQLFTGVLHDLSERKAFEKQLEHQATHDALTGLPNRALLTAELEAALTRADRHSTNVAVWFVELGRIKLVTDSLGHRAGDQIVSDAAARLVRVLGPDATVTRFGGNHFVVFAEDLEDVGDAAEVATQVIDALDRPYVIGSEEAFIKTAVGIAFAVNGAGSAESMISNADVAMNRARTAATTGYEVFDSEMRQWVDNRRTLENAMRRGIERGEFELFYQPVVTVATGTIHGFEALVRWNHPELGLLPPIEFIPLAEDSDLIVPLGERILRDACRQLAAWQRTYPERGLTVSVNLSGRQLALPDLSATVAAALIESGADPKGLDLEITETVLLDDVDAAVRTLDGLKKIGVNLAVDDFGTGYSSLTYLCRFPIDVVKVDRSFVSQIGTPSRDASIVSVVVGMAQTLHMDVVAEGVETAEQLAALEDLDCSYAQGYLFSKPKPLIEIEQLLLTRP